MATREALRRQDEEMRVRLFGAQAGAPERGDSTPGFRHLMSEAVFGAVWGRPGLALPDRMICTLAALGALQRLAQPCRILESRSVALRAVSVTPGKTPGFPQLPGRPS